jgi:alcohol dehydrogenase class IV
MAFSHPSLMPSLVILDPDLTTTTPEWAWLSTGVRAIDHCVETRCAIAKTSSITDQNSEEALRLLVPNLIKSKHDPTDLEARHLCQMGANQAIRALGSGVQMGGSHGIGHQLGPFGVGHGQTSCILLPAVMKYNAAINKEKQQAIKDLLWDTSVAGQILKARGLEPNLSDAGDALRAIFLELGMPKSLVEVGVGKDKIDTIAQNSLSDEWCKSNPIPLLKKDQILEILSIVAE